MQSVFVWYHENFFVGIFFDVSIGIEWISGLRLFHDVYYYFKVLLKRCTTQYSFFFQQIFGAFLLAVSETNRKQSGT